MVLNLMSQIQLHDVITIILLFALGLWNFYLQKYIVNRFKMKQEKVKVYKKAFELTYRTRNSAKDIIKYDFNNKNINEFLRHQNELNEFIYEERYDLEFIKCFKPLHSYKNLLITFSETLPQSSTEPVSDEVIKDIEIELKNIENKYNTISKIIKSSQSGI